MWVLEIGRVKNNFDSFYNGVDLLMNTKLDSKVDGKSHSRVSHRLIETNHPSRINAERMSIEHLRHVAKGCHTEYVSPFQKIGR